MNALKRARQIAGLSASELAKEIGVKPLTVYRYESGEYSVPYKRALMLVGRLSECGLTLRHFGYGGDDE